jgi:drug/metabolite transporter (DMT)-like permease
MAQAPVSMAAAWGRPFGTSRKYPEPEKGVVSALPQHPLAVPGPCTPITRGAWCGAARFRAPSCRTSPVTQDRPLLGIALMLGFCIAAPAGDAVAKLLGDSVPLVQMVLLRFVIQLAMLVPLIRLSGRPWRIGGRTLRIVWLRTAIHVAGIAAMFTALRYLPLADAVAIVFVMPFFMLILGHTVLGEEVGRRRMIACAAGFAGTLLVVQPSFAEVGWPALLPVFVAGSLAVFMLLTRQIAKETDPVSLQAVSGGMAIVMVLPLMLLGPLTDAASLQVIAPSARDWALLVGIGAIGTVAHLLMTWSLRFAPSATLAPMQYLEIPIATLIGLAVFGDLPNGIAALGIVITMASGVYIILRERATARTPAVTGPIPRPAGAAARGSQASPAPPSAG